MSKFLTDPCYRNLDGTRLCLTEELIYRIGDGLECLIVPVGFECDGQSYPRLLWLIDTPQGHGVKAGIVHDYLYGLNGRPVPGLGMSFDRAAADRIFREALIASGVNEMRAAIRYRALRMFGWKAWNDHAKRIAKEKKV